MISEVRCCDCMDMMREFPDGFFDLAVIDPPYGLGEKLAIGGTKHMKFCEKYQKSTHWDVPPPPEYFKELFRVSKHQIIWGGNYFNLGPCRCFVIWDKLQPVPNFSACEFAWTSFDRPSKIFRYNNNQYDVGGRIHPTQKPVPLYKFTFNEFAKPGDKILDTHMGSQSSRIAAHIMGFDYWGAEIDPEYFRDGCARYEKEAEQGQLFTQEMLFRS